MAIYRERIEAAVKPLLQEGFSVADVLEDAKNFGDTRVVLHRSDVRIRLTSDRGQVFLDVGHPSGEGWFDMNELLRRVDVIAPQLPWESPAEAVNSLRRNIAIIVASLQRDDLLGLMRRRT